MKKLLLLFLFLSPLLSDSYSQQFPPEWVARFNASDASFDFPKLIAVDSTGNVYVTGKSFGDKTNYDYSTIKYSTTGVFQWEARYNGPGNYIDEPTGIVVDKFGNVFVTGFSYGGSSDYDYATLKYNVNGVQQWVDRYNGPADSTDNANSICVDLFGNIYVTGESRKLGGQNSNSYDCVTIKYNTSGNRTWTKNYEFQPGSEDYGKIAKTDNSGNVYVVGNVYDRLLTLKYNSVGTFQWSVVTDNGINGNFIFSPNSFDIDLLGNSYIIGLSDSSRLIKLNTSGVRQWMNTYLDFAPCSVVVDSNGNANITGIASDIPGTPDVLTFKYNTNGVQQWKQRYNGNGNLVDNAYSLCLDVSGNVYIAGESIFPSTGPDFVIIKYNSSGIKQWVSRYDASGQPKAIATDYSGNIYLTGYDIGYLTEYDYLTLKYPSSLQLNATIIIEGFYDENNNRLNKKDTLTAYLRNTTSPFSIVDSGKAVVDTLTFRCGFCFNYAPAGTYYITIKHRNSIETWSKASGELFSKSAPTYFDFTIANTQAYGNRLKLKGSKYCIYSGDIDQSGFIDVTDLILTFNKANAITAGDFISEDVNGDLIVDAADITICYNNARSLIGVITP